MPHHSSIAGSQLAQLIRSVSEIKSPLQALKEFPPCHRPTSAFITTLFLEPKTKNHSFCEKGAIVSTEILEE